MPVESEELDVYDIYGDGLGLFGEAAVAQGMILTLLRSPLDLACIDLRYLQACPGNALRCTDANFGFLMYLEAQESSGSIGHFIYLLYSDTNYPCLYNTVSLMSHYLWNSSLVMAEYIQDLKFPVTGMNG